MLRNQDHPARRRRMLRPNRQGELLAVFCPQRALLPQHLRPLPAVLPRLLDPSAAHLARRLPVTEPFHDSVHRLHRHNRAQTIHHVRVRRQRRVLHLSRLRDSFAGTSPPAPRSRATSSPAPLIRRRGRLSTLDHGRPSRCRLRHSARTSSTCRAACAASARAR